MFINYGVILSETNQPKGTSGTNVQEMRSKKARRIKEQLYCIQRYRQEPT